MVRFKRRYALCEVVYPNNCSPARITDNLIFKAVKKALQETHGDLGLASLKFSLNIKYANPDTNLLIIRGDRKYFDLLTSALIFVNKIDQYDAFLNTLHVGGSIRSCQKFIIKYHKQNLPLLYPSCKTDEQRAQIMASIMEACEKMESIKQVVPKAESTPSAMDMIISSEHVSVSLS